jgi:RHS repeat-associated protein
MLTLDLPGTSQDIAYTYDSGTYGIGRLTGITDQSGTLAFQYDKRGNLTQEQKTMEGHVFTTQYQYDQNGNLKKIIYPNGREVTYTLNQANQITQIVGTKDSTNTTYAQSATYAPFGPLKTYTAGNGLPIINQYDDDYQLTNLKAGAVINRDYQYDETSNVTQISNMGNLPVSSAETMTYSYQNNNNQLTQAINGTSTTFAYNAAGNLITEQKSGTTRTFTYNDAQRLASVTEGSITLGEYSYDALGRRKKKVPGGNTTLYIYDQNGLLIEECSSDGTWQKDYIYLNGQPLAMIVANAPENVYYYHNDHLGTSQMMTDSTGAVVWSAQYEPFGEATINIGQITNNLRFPGQYFDAETGLNYNWHRDYKPELGRYIESDPIGLRGGINLYTYALNSPLKFVDPKGFEIPTPPSWLDPNYKFPGEKTYEDLQGIRSDMQRKYPGESNFNDKMRHCVASCLIAQKYGKGLARSAGVVNEVQGLVLDIYRIFRRRPTGAFEFSDFKSNEIGFKTAGVVNSGRYCDCDTACKTMYLRGDL